MATVAHHAPRASHQSFQPKSPSGCLDISKINGAGNSETRSRQTISSRSKSTTEATGRGCECTLFDLTFLPLFLVPRQRQELAAQARYTSMLSSAGFRNPPPIVRALTGRFAVSDDGENDHLVSVSRWLLQFAFFGPGLVLRRVGYRSEDLSGGLLWRASMRLHLLRRMLFRFNQRDRR